MQSAVETERGQKKASLALSTTSVVVCCGRGLHAEARTAAAAANPSSISPNVPLKATRATALDPRLLGRSRIPVANGPRTTTADTFGESVEGKERNHRVVLFCVHFAPFFGVGFVVFRSRARVLSEGLIFDCAPLRSGGTIDLR
jgi:hypothetical protein